MLPCLPTAVPPPPLDPPPGAPLLGHTCTPLVRSPLRPRRRGGRGWGWWGPRPRHPTAPSRSRGLCGLDAGPGACAPKSRFPLRATNLQGKEVGRPPCPSTVATPSSRGAPARCSWIRQCHSAVAHHGSYVPMAQCTAPCARPHQLAPLMEEGWTGGRPPGEYDASGGPPSIAAVAAVAACRGTGGATACGGLPLAAHAHMPATADSVFLLVAMVMRPAERTAWHAKRG